MLKTFTQTLAGRNSWGGISRDIFFKLSTVLKEPTNIKITKNKSETSGHNLHNSCPENGKALVINSLYSKTACLSKRLFKLDSKI